MVGRIVAIAISLAVLVLSGGIWAWWLDARGAEELVQARRQAARALYESGERRPEVIIHALEAPGIRIIVEDHDALEVYENVGDTIVHHPGGSLPPGPLPIAGAPRTVGVPPGRKPRPAGAAYPPPYSPLDIVASHLANVPALRAGSVTGAMQIIVLPLGSAFKRFLFIDAAAVAVLLLAIAVGATMLSTRLLGVERARLVRRAEERQALATEYQRFLADAGHELRTPLTIASGYIEILSAQLENRGAELDRVLSGIRGEMTRMRGLVEKMLLLARLEAPVSVPNLVDAGAVAGLSVEAMRRRFPQREITLARSGPAAVVIDQDDLYEALRNLVENALKYAPASPVHVKAEVCDSQAVLSVTDYGPGIAQSEREAVFERFYRGEQRAEAEGSGLGLAIVRRVADRWRGTIELDSRPAQTVFTLRFPLADEV